MQEINESSQELDELFAALSLAQAQMESAKKDSDNPFFKSKYADYGSVWDAVKKPLTSNGLSYILLPSGGPDVYTFTGILAHKSGQFLKTSLQVKPADLKIQAYGSLVTYVKRYMLTSLTGVALDDDDDGNVASVRTTENAHRPAPNNYKQPSPPAPPVKKEVKNFAPKGPQAPPSWLQETQNRVLGNKDLEIPEKM